MKTINKRSDARSYSPLSFLGNSSLAKGVQPESNKIKQGQVDIAAALTFKPQKNPLNYQKSNMASNYVRKTRRKDSSGLNNTVVHDEYQRNSSFEENVNNLSYVDGMVSKNVSHQIDPFQSGLKEKNLKTFSQKYGNTPIASHKHNNSYGNALLPLEHPPEGLDSKFLNKADYGLLKRDDRNSYLNNFSRKNNETSLIYPPSSSSKPKEEPILFPKIKNARTLVRGKDEIKNEKMSFMERTYSLSPYKQKNSKGPAFPLNPTQEPRTTEISSKGNKANRTQEQFYKAKLPFEVGSKGRENKSGARGRQVQVISKFETPKTQTHSPTDHTTLKHNSTAMLHKDQSWGAGSMISNTSQVQVNSQYQYGSSKEIPSVSSLNKSRNNSRIVDIKDENGCIERKSGEKNNDNFYIAMGVIKSKQISDFSQKDLNTTVPKILIERAPSSSKRTPKRTRAHNKTQVDFGDRFQTIANTSVTNICESVDISSSREPSSKGRENQRATNSELNSPEIIKKKNLLEPAQPNGLGRHESHENVLDDFAEKSVLVSVQDQNQSFLSNGGKGQFDEMLETSLISYLDEKEKVQKSRKELEITLSMSKHPAFKRSKVVVSKGTNSVDKDPPYMASTNMTNSTYKNESCQLKNEEFFQADVVSLEKSRVFEVDFNFAEDMKNSGNPISPSFPAGQALNIKPVPNKSEEERKIQGVKRISKEPLRKSKKQVNLDKLDNFDVSASQEGIEENEQEETPTANSSFIKQSFFNSPSKMNPFPDIEELEQSFNENPMNSMSTYTLSEDHDGMENNIRKEQLSVRDSEDIAA